jgi:hypothetical protein
MAEEERGEYYVPPTLGELSRSLGVERRELEAFDLEGKIVPPAHPGGPSQVADLARGTGIIDTIETQKISPRPPALLYQVVSTYDSRPIQAYDFQHSECGNITWIAGGSGSEFNPVTFTYIVPDNTIAILRAFRYQVTTAPINAVTEGDCWLFSDLIVNDLPVREYNRMLHPVFMQRFFDTFLIVDERKRLTLQLRMADDGTDVVEFYGDLEANDLQSPVLAELYGNLLLKTGVPVEFEIANAIGGGQL